MKVNNIVVKNFIVRENIDFSLFISIDSEFLKTQKYEKNISRDKNFSAFVEANIFIVEKLYFTYFIFHYKEIAGKNKNPF
jgi:hypothetical protein